MQFQQIPMLENDLRGADFVAQNFLRIFFSVISFRKTSQIGEIKMAI